MHVPTAIPDGYPCAPAVDSCQAGADAFIKIDLEKNQ
jgi:hypothetical protein